MTEGKARKGLPIAVYMIYLVLFFSVWTVYELFGKEWLGAHFSDVVTVILMNSIKLAIWFVVSFMLIKKYNDYLATPYREMFTHPVNWKKIWPIFIGFTLYIGIGSFVVFGNIAVRDDFQFSNLFGMFLFVGITEEMVFRGWLLNAFLKSMNKWPAILLNSVLFLFIHFPVWIKSGSFMENMTSGSFMVVVILSIIFSLTFIKTKNIWVPITLHMYWDLLMILFW